MDASDQRRHIVRISIFNQSYSVTTAGDPGEMERLAHEVDELMTAIAHHTGSSDATRTAVLACLHLADKLRTAQGDLRSLRESVVDKSRNFAELLDQAFSTVKEP